MNENAKLYELTKLLAVEMTARTGELFRADINPDSWRTGINSDSAYITITLDRSRREEKIKAWASTPAGIERRRDDLIISMSAKRAPAQIAQDIHRRLYAHAQAYLINCKTEQAKSDKQERKENLIKNLLRPYLREQEHGYNKSGRATMVNHNIRAEIYTNDIELKLNVTPSEALKICKLLQEIK